MIWATRNFVYILLLCGLYYLFLINSCHNIDFHKKARNVKIYIPNTQQSPLHVHIHGRINLYPNQKQMNGLKYILVWYPNMNPFHLLRETRSSFITNNCNYTNCYVTHNKKYLNDIKDFDAILFSSTVLRSTLQSEVLNIRSLKQKFVFASLEAPPFHPVTNPVFDDYFNWTWTYRLRSDVSWKYITIYDLNGNVVGPAIDMNWPKYYKPINDYLKTRLKRKTKAVAWISSHCKTHSQRENIVKNLEIELHSYGWNIDKFGSCGNAKCSRSLSCYKMLQRKYYFYLSFENSMEEDYVTEKLIIALNNFLVPIVYGAANYFRFLPPGSYLNARELGPKVLAKIMNDAMKNLTLYFDFFRWRNHFKYKSSESNTEICNICTALNNKTLMTQNSSYKQFRLWWNGPLRQKTYDFMLKNFLTNNALLNLAASYNFTRQNSLVLLNQIKNQTKSDLARFLNSTLKPNKTLRNSTYGSRLLKLINKNSSILNIPTFVYNFTTTDINFNDSVVNTTTDTSVY